MENLLYISENNLLQGNETNFITQQMLFNQANTWTILSGAGTVDIINQNQYEGNGCLRIVPNSGVSITVSGTDTLQTITEEADYILSFKVKTVLSATDVIYVRITVFINATPVDYEYFIDGLTSPNVEDYKTLFLNLGTLPIGATLDFNLEVSATSYGALAKTYWDAFYLQKNTSGLGIPNVFTAPNYDIVGTGWAQYSDNVKTSVSPLVINSGTRAKLTNNAFTVINSQLPEGVASFWDAVNNKIIGVNNGDKFDIDIRFKAKASANNSYLDVSIDIGGAFGEITEDSRVFTRDANTEQRFNIHLGYFTGSTFVANGGDIYIEAFTGNISIYDIVFLITRVYKGK